MPLLEVFSGVAQELLHASPGPVVGALATAAALFGAAYLFRGGHSKREPAGELPEPPEVLELAHEHAPIAPAEARHGGPRAPTDAGLTI
eukprot:tig00021038_g17556.t1